MASCGQWPNGNGHTNVYDPVANSWSPGGAIKDVVRNEAGEMIKVAGKPRMFILGGYDEASTFLNPVNVSEIGKAGALSGAQDAPTHVVRATATTAATS